MKKNFRGTPEVIFIDATYKINREGFCLSAIMCEDKNGVGQAAFVGLLSSEKEENLVFLFESFKDAHPEHWERVEVAFTDKDFHEIALLKRELPQARPLLCVFHVVKWMETKIARLPNVKEDGLRIYQLFNKVLHCYNEDNFEKNWQDLIEDGTMTEEFRDYLQGNWYDCRESWAYPFRNVRTYGNNTNNTIESLFHALKAAIRMTRRTAPALSEFIEIL